VPVQGLLRVAEGRGRVRLGGEGLEQAAEGIRRLRGQLEAAGQLVERFS
jgi:hypothetical protein